MLLNFCHRHEYIMSYFHHQLQAFRSVVVRTGEARGFNGHLIVFIQIPGGG